MLRLAGRNHCFHLGIQTSRHNQDLSLGAAQQPQLASRHLATANQQHALAGQTQESGVIRPMGRLHGAKRNRSSAPRQRCA